MALILIVEDEPALARLLARYLTSAGHEIRTAESGKRALEEMDGVDAVLTDINMPDMDGIELIMKLRQEHPRMPVIAMSGGGVFDKGMLLDAADKLGAVMTLEKPFDLEVLQAAVADLLQKADRPDS